MRTALLVAAIMFFAWCALIGFGVVDNPDLAEDYLGWIAFGAACVAGSFLVRD